MPTDMIVSQAASVLNALHAQGTGVSAIGPITNTADFVSAAQTALKTGYDPVVNAISQVWNRTIFSVRDYSAPFAKLEMEADRWGNATRKISFADKNVEDDERYKYPVGYDAGQNPADGNGLSVDMFKLHKPKIQQVAFYGQSTYEDCESIFRDNLDVAFTSPEEFMRFNSAEMQTRFNKLEQYRENTRRGLLANAVASLIDENDGNRVIHVLSEYNDYTGGSYTATTIMAADVFPDFIRWLYGFISTLARRFALRSNLFQTVVNNFNVMRHTPADRLNIYIASGLYDQINSRVRSTTYHDDKLNDANWEAVDYWQSISDPLAVNITATYTKTDGTVASKSVSEDGIIGLIFDDDAIGYAMVNNWSSVTPFVSNGGYWNDWYHANFRSRFDMTEKMAVLVLD